MKGENLFSLLSFLREASDPYRRSLDRVVFRAWHFYDARIDDFEAFSLQPLSFFVGFTSMTNWA